MCAATRVSKLEVSEKQKRNYHDRISKMTLMKKSRIQIAFDILEVFITKLDSFFPSANLGFYLII